jgi:hypothetical protein
MKFLDLLYPVFLAVFVAVFSIFLQQRYMHQLEEKSVSLPPCSLFCREQVSREGDHLSTAAIRSSYSGHAGEDSGPGH